MLGKDYATAKAAWLAALDWYQDQTDEFSQDRKLAALRAFDRWWAQRQKVRK